MKGILKLKKINNKNKYEVELNKYNGTEVKVLSKDSDTYEIKTFDGSE